MHTKNYDSLHTRTNYNGRLRITKKKEREKCEETQAKT